MCQRDLYATALHPALQEIHFEVVNAQYGFASVPAPAQKNPQPRQQFCKGKRFDKIVVCAGIQSDYTVFQDRKSTRLNSSHTVISYAVFCLKKKKNKAFQYANITEKPGSSII